MIWLRRPSGNFVDRSGAGRSCAVAGVALLLSLAQACSAGESGDAGGEGKILGPCSVSAVPIEASQARPAYDEGSSAALLFKVTGSCGDEPGQSVYIQLLELTRADFSRAVRAYVACTRGTPAAPHLELSFPRTLLGRIATHVECDIRDLPKLTAVRNQIEQGQAVLAPGTAKYSPFETIAPEVESTVTDSFHAKPKAGIVLATIKPATPASSDSQTMVCIRAASGFRDLSGDVTVNYTTNDSITDCFKEYLDTGKRHG